MQSAIVFAAFKRTFLVSKSLSRPVIKQCIRFSSHACIDTACSDPTHVHTAPPSRSTGCWSCGNCVNFYDWFCKKCDYIQPPSGETNLFRLFGIPEAFDVPDAVVERAFKSLQKFVHPDKFGNRTEREKEYSSQRSTELNRAYEILRNPVSRAQHLLFLHGIDAIGESASTAVDKRLLMEIMDKREALEEATNVSDLRALQAENDRCIRAQIVELNKAFGSSSLAAAKQATITLQYYTKLQQEIGDRLLRKEIAQSK